VSSSQSYEYPIAPRSKRMAAFVIDDIVVSIFLVIIFYDQLSALKDPMALSLFLQNNLMLFMLLKLLYQTFFVWYNGMTPGKMLVKIRVIEMEGGYIPSLGTAFLRALLRMVSEMLFYVGYLMAYFNPLVQTLHDKLAKTVVVDA